MHRKIRTKIQSEIGSIKKLEDVRQVLLSVLAEFQDGQKRIGYVAGIVASDGRDKIGENIRALDDFAENIRRANDFPVFSVADVFNDIVYEAVNLELLSGSDFELFWRDVLGSGYVTDIFMGPRWAESDGARDEHEFSKSAGIRIHY